MLPLENMMQWLFVEDISLLVLIKLETNEKGLLFKAGEEARVVVRG